MRRVFHLLALGALAPLALGALFTVNADATCSRCASVGLDACVLHPPCPVAAAWPDAFPATLAPLTTKGAGNGAGDGTGPLDLPLCCDPTSGQFDAAACIDALQDLVPGGSSGNNGNNGNGSDNDDIGNVWAFLQAFFGWGSGAGSGNQYGNGPNFGIGEGYGFGFPGCDVGRAARRQVLCVADEATCDLLLGAYIPKSECLPPLDQRGEMLYVTALEALTLENALPEGHGGYWDDAEQWEQTFAAIRASPMPPPLTAWDTETKEDFYAAWLDAIHTLYACGDGLEGCDGAAVDWAAECAAEEHWVPWCPCGGYEEFVCPPYLPTPDYTEACWVCYDAVRNGSAGPGQPRHAHCELCAAEMDMRYADVVENALAARDDVLYPWWDVPAFGYWFGDFFPTPDVPYLLLRSRVPGLQRSLAEYLHPAGPPHPGPFWRRFDAEDDDPTDSPVPPALVPCCAAPCESCPLLHPSMVTDYGSCKACVGDGHQWCVYDAGQARVCVSDECQCVGLGGAITSCGA